MRQTMILFASLLLLPFSAHAQENPEIMAPYEAGFSASPTQRACAMLQNEDEDEYDYKEMITLIGDNATVGAPIVSTQPVSQSEAIYQFIDLRMLKGDKITKIGHIGYNPGDEVKKHVIVWMQNIRKDLGQVESSFESVDNMTKVFEGDIVIKSGGQPDDWTQLTDITLDEPFTYDDDDVRITILSYGEVSDHDVYFVRSTHPRSALCSTSDQLEDISANPNYDKCPLMKYTVASKVEYLTGQVTDQDGNPIVGAEVTLGSCRWNSEEYHGLTDDEGNYQVRVPGNNTFLPAAKASGHVPFVETIQNYSFYEDYYFMTPCFDDKKMNFTLFNAIDFKADVAGTIILPVEPDPTLGKYYRLDRWEDNVLVFVREPIPQANVPYILIANEDCRVDISEMDLTGTPGETAIEHIKFIGSYENTDSVYTTNQGLYFIDQTPDCGGSPWHVGGCRAYLLVDLLYCPSTLYFALTEGAGVEQLILAPKGDSVDCYDLQGRKLPSGTIPRGIFISNGKKQLGR